MRFAILGFLSLAVALFNLLPIPPLDGMLRIEIFTHRRDRAAAKRDQEVVLLSIATAVLKVAARLRLDGDAIAFRDGSNDFHLQAAVELGQHALE